MRLLIYTEMWQLTVESGPVFAFTLDQRWFVSREPALTAPVTPALDLSKINTFNNYSDATKIFA